MALAKHYTVVSLNLNLINLLFLNRHKNLLPDSVTSREGLLFLQLASSFIHANQVAKKCKNVLLAKK